jgi:hypothetical protein
MTVEASRKTEKVTQDKGNRAGLLGIEHFKPNRKSKTFIFTMTKAPKRGSPEVPILAILARSPETGTRTRIVLQEVERLWFRALDADDLKAVYPGSKKRVVQTVVKYARKHLIGKGEIFPPSEENPVGYWRATEKGILRAINEQGSWMPSYADVASMIEAEEMTESQNRDLEIMKPLPPEFL